MITASTLRQILFLLTFALLCWATARCQGGLP